MKRISKPAALAVMVFSLNGIASHAVSAAEKPAASQPGAVPAEWARHAQGGKFSFRTPAEIKEEKVQGIDSLVGQWRGAGVSIGSDYGWYSDPMTNRGQPKYIRTDVVVDGKEAYVVTFERPESKEFPFTVGIHFPNVTGDKKIRLTIYIQCKDAAAMELARKIVHTVKFD